MMIPFKVDLLIPSLLLNTFLKVDVFFILALGDRHLIFISTFADKFTYIMHMAIAIALSGNVIIYIDEMNHTIIMCTHKVQTRWLNMEGHFSDSVNVHLLFWQVTLEGKCKVSDTIDERWTICRGWRKKPLKLRKVYSLTLLFCKLGKGLCYSALALESFRRLH